MKRLLMYLLTICMSLVCLSSCRSTPQRESKIFFSKEILTEASLTDMPVPNLDGAVLENGEKLYCTLTDQEYADYMQRVLDYLFAREDIYYLSYPVSSGLNLFVPMDSVAPITADYDVTEKERNVFIFSTSDTLSGNNFLSNPTWLTVSRLSEQATIENSTETYNTIISITVGAFRHAQYDDAAATHTYDEGTVYPIPGSTQTCTISYCVYCGASDYSPFIGDGNGAYKVTVTQKDGNYLMNDCIYEKHVSGILYTLYPLAVDEDMVVTVNGMEIPLTYEKAQVGIRYCYAFIMPCSDIEIEVYRRTSEPAPDEDTEE